MSLSPLIKPFGAVAYVHPFSIWPQFTSPSPPPPSPGPSYLESKVTLQYSDSIHKAMIEPVPVVNQLYSGEVVGFHVWARVIDRSTNWSNYDRAVHVVGAIVTKLEATPKAEIRSQVFETALEIMKRHVTLECIAKEIEEEYKKRKLGEIEITELEEISDDEQLDEVGECLNELPIMPMNGTKLQKTCSSYEASLMQSLSRQLNVGQDDVLSPPSVGSIRTVQTLQEHRLSSTASIMLDRDVIDHFPNNSLFVWKIPEIARRYRDAQERRILNFYSPYFHAFPFGYRMRINTYLNGYGAGKGTHISVFFELMESEYDDILLWPFSYPVTFQLLNRDNSSMKASETIIPKVSDPCYQKPKAGVSTPCGFSCFVEQTVLDEPEYTEGDTLYIGCKVHSKL